MRQTRHRQTHVINSVSDLNASLCMDAAGLAYLAAGQVDDAIRGGWMGYFKAPPSWRRALQTCEGAACTAVQPYMHALSDNHRSRLNEPFLLLSLLCSVPRCRAVAHVLCVGISRGLARRPAAPAGSWPGRRTVCHWAGGRGSGNQPGVPEKCRLGRCGEAGVRGRVRTRKRSGGAGPAPQPACWQASPRAGKLPSPSPACHGSRAVLLLAHAKEWREALRVAYGNAR